MGPQAPHLPPAVRGEPVPASFVEVLMDHIMEGMMIPKVQIERVVGPILGMFLADVLTSTLQEDTALSGPIQMICPEFPFKKSDNNQSTNIDWLLYNPDRKQLLFLELKTADSSVDTDQAALYRAKQEAVRTKGGSFLLKELKQLRDASGEHGKYGYILKHMVGPFEGAIAECTEARIIYLVPKSAEGKIKGHADKVLTFEMLAAAVPGPFAEEWAVIRDRLCLLDRSSKSIRNWGSKDHSKTAASGNFLGTMDFRSILEFCDARGDDIVVGFQGGAQALTVSDPPHLQRRTYKWDYAAGGTGIKTPANWIRGRQFLAVINQVLAGLDRTFSLPPSQKLSPKWQTLGFQEMFDLCVERGDEVIIGFMGGKDSLSRTSLADLKKRRAYKWDLAQDLAGKKRSHWLLGSEVLEILHSHHGYPIAVDPNRSV